MKIPPHVAMSALIMERFAKDPEHFDIRVAQGPDFMAFLIKIQGQEYPIEIVVSKSTRKDVFEETIEEIDEDKLQAVLKQWTAQSGSDGHIH